MERYTPIKKWITFRLEENLKLSDLMKNVGISAFTAQFKKETDKLMGSASKHTKLLQGKINKKKDYITFTFATERTPKYDDNFNLMASNPDKAFALQKDNLYTIEIRFLKYFDTLMKDYNEEEGLTNKKIEDAFMQCDIQVWSECPSFHWQGGNFWLSRDNAAIHPTNIAPKHWINYSDSKIDKHTQGVISGIKFWIPMMRQIVKKAI